MATVLNRTTKELLHSVHTPRFPVAAWIINPALRAVARVAKRYWIIEGDAVRAANASERLAIDAAALTARKAALVARIDAAHDAALRVADLTQATNVRSAVNGASTVSAAETAARDFLRGFGGESE